MVTNLSISHSPGCLTSVILAIPPLLTSLLSHVCIGQILAFFKDGYSQKDNRIPNSNALSMHITSWHFGKSQINADISTFQCSDLSLVINKAMTFWFTLIAIKLRCQLVDHLKVHRNCKCAHAK